MTSAERTKDSIKPLERIDPSTEKSHRAGPADHSILFRDLRVYFELDSATPPDCFSDLHLDHIVTAIIAGREMYTLAPYFYIPLRSTADVRYRQAVMSELEREDISQAFRYFADRMQSVHRHLDVAQKTHIRHEKVRWFLDAAALYREGISHFERMLAEVSLESDGLRGVREFIRNLTASEEFRNLAAQSLSLLGRLKSVRYVVRISDRRVVVSAAEGEPDYAPQLQRDFRAFNQGHESSPFGSSEELYMNHVEEAILNMVAQLYPETFDALEDFYDTRHLSLIAPNIQLFERELQFCLACQGYVGKLRAAGLSFCNPEVVDEPNRTSATEIFDLALAGVLVQKGQPVITNSFYLEEKERTIVVSGPNQGGKTTFARTIGQIHHLARIGCPVPGKDACIALCDAIFTIFEKREDIRTQTGKLEEELLRIHAVLQAATPNSLLIMNESLSSTSANDAVILGRKLLERISRIGLRCVLVTFLDELSAFSSSTVSMVAAVDSHDPSKRTFEVVRTPADGRAYAIAIAEKYRLRRETIQSRIARRPN